MDLTVIIATQDRADALSQTLTTLAACDPPPGEWELLLIDNGKTGETRMTADAFAGRLPIRYEAVPQPGKSNALNRAVSIAKSDRLVFLDDDVIVEPGLLRVYCEHFDKYPDTHLFGGLIELALPSDYDNDLVSLRHAKVVLAQIDFGNETRYLKWPETPAGPNMAVRKSGLESALGNKKWFAAISNKQPLVDTFFFRRAMQKGLRCLYVPKAKVGHLVRKEQLSFRYFMKRYANHRISEMLLDPIPPAKTWFGAPRFLFRSLLTKAMNYPLLAVQGRKGRMAAALDLEAELALIRYFSKEKPAAFAPA